MKCSKCGEELTQEMIDVNMCWNCGNILDKSLLDDETIEKIEEEATIINPLASERYQRFILTTGPSIDGHTIESYLGLVSGEVVIGTGLLSTFTSGVADFFGVETKAYSGKMKAAKNGALAQMLEEAFEKDATAIIGISFEYMPLSRDLIGVSVNGTAVKIKKEKDN